MGAGCRHPENRITARALTGAALHVAPLKRPACFPRSRIPPPPCVSSQALPQAQLLESKRLVKSLLAYVRAAPEDTDPLFAMLSIFQVSNRDPIAYSL